MSIAYSTKKQKRKIVSSLKRELKRQVLAQKIDLSGDEPRLPRRIVMDQEIEAGLILILDFIMQQASFKETERCARILEYENPGSSKRLQPRDMKKPKDGMVERPLLLIQPDVPGWAKELGFGQAQIYRYLKELLMTPLLELKRRGSPERGPAIYSIGYFIPELRRFKIGDRYVWQELPWGRKVFWFRQKDNRDFLREIKTAKRAKHDNKNEQSMIIRPRLNIILGGKSTDKHWLNRKFAVACI